jgi:hypothetical protein
MRGPAGALGVGVLGQDLPDCVGEGVEPGRRAVAVGPLLDGGDATLGQVVEEGLGAGPGFPVLPEPGDGVLERARPAARRAEQERDGWFLGLEFGEDGELVEGEVVRVGLFGGVAGDRTPWAPRCRRVAAVFAVRTVAGFIPVARPIAAWDSPRFSMVCTALACSAPVRPSRARPVTAMVTAASLAVAVWSRTRQGRSAPAWAAAATRRLPSTATCVTVLGQSPGTVWAGTTISGTRTPTSRIDAARAGMSRPASRMLSGCCPTCSGRSRITASISVAARSVWSTGGWVVTVMGDPSFCLVRALVSAAGAADLAGGAMG